MTHEEIQKIRELQVIGKTIVEKCYTITKYNDFQPRPLWYYVWFNDKIKIKSNCSADDSETEITIRNLYYFNKQKVFKCGWDGRIEMFRVGNWLYKIEELYAKALCHKEGNKTSKEQKIKLNFSPIEDFNWESYLKNRSLTLTEIDERNKANVDN